MLRLPLFAALCSLFVSLAAAAEPSPPATLLSTPGKLLFADELATQPDKKDWRYGPGDWTIADGALKGSERAADKHGAVLRHNLKDRDVVIRYDFRFDGAKGSTLSINDAKEHVCRVILSPKFIRAQKDDHDHAGPDTAVPFDTQKIDLKPGEWHTLVVEMVGPELVATVDGKVTSFGSHPLIESEKGNFGFTVSGESMAFRNLGVWQAEAKASWKAKKAELEQAKSTAAKP